VRTRAIAQNGCEQQDKHLKAHLIPISLTMVEQQAASELAKAAKPLQGTDFGSDWSNAPFTARCPSRVTTDKTHSKHNESALDG
jgi:hypothetical protein